jgi:recombination protein RecT
MASQGIPIPARAFEFSNRAGDPEKESHCMADQQQQQTQIEILNPKTIGQTLEKMKPQIEMALPRHMTPDRMARIALTCLRMNPKLFRCTQDSFFGAIITASQLGLEPNVNGQCYLIPYGNVCTLVPGWRGYMDLLSRTGRASAWTGAVYEDDEFEYEYGSKPYIHHKPGKWSGDPKALDLTYSVGRVNGSEWPIIEVWDVDRIKAQRDRNNKVGNDHYSFKYFEMYARKLPLLQVLKYLPQSVEMATASALDVTGSEGRQKLTIDGSFKGAYTDGGEDSDKLTEIEFLMEKLNWEGQKRDAVRQSYEGRTDELLSYLKGQAGPVENGKKDSGGATSTSSKKTTTTEKKDTPPAAQQTTQSAQATTERKPDPEPEKQKVAESEIKVKPEPRSFKF